MKHLLRGIVLLGWWFFAIIITFPIWILIFAYDLSKGTDKTSNFFEKMGVL
jgi:hypothetical protein